MRDIRGPEFSVPDSVPDELVAIYGAEARSAVRSRKSWQTRQSARIRAWLGRHDGWYLAATALLWSVILAGLGGALAVAALHWPLQTLAGGVLVAVALLSSAVTAVVVRRRTRAGR